MSYAGGLQIVKAMLISLSIYWVASFTLPKRTVDGINRLYRNFLWSEPDCLTSHALIGWNDMQYPYDEGGLTIRDLAIVNNATIMRHAWNIVSKKKILWVKWFEKHLIKNRNFWELKIPANASWSEHS